MSFNPRARAGRDHTCPCVSFHPLLFQSTRPCGARQCKASNYYTQAAVSIHAPVRGATIFSRRGRRGVSVSIHAPVRGATADSYVDLGGKIVSIHAPVRGATI